MYSKLTGLTIEEFIHKVVFEEITEVNYFDGEVLEQLLEDYTLRIEQNFEDRCEAEVDSLSEELMVAENYIEKLESLLEENGIEY